MLTKVLRQLLLGLFAITIFVSAFLLFQVQPIMAKFILPWFGGSPGVWTACMLVFQVLLFAGYAYAHLLDKYLPISKQVLLHIAVLILAALLLPITPSQDWKPQGDDSPTWLIVSLLIVKIGLPYFVLSSTGPLLQSWLGQTEACDQPHRLYSLSNVGSLLALLSFPFVFEPAFSSTQQSTIWSITFVVFAVSCGISAVVIFSSCRSSKSSNFQSVDTNSAAAINPSTVGSWFVLSMLPSTMLLATTNQVCLDVGVIPFLWVIPLSIYLLSFVLTFESERWYHRRLCVLLAMVSFLLLYLSKMIEYKVPLLLELGLHFAGLFFACMVCHGELVRLRPEAKRLTAFYLTMSAGGACGGLFVGLLAPILFNGYFEWQLALLACILVFLETYLRSNEQWTDRVPLSVKWGLAVGLPVLAICWLSFWNARSNGQIAAARNFYGVLSVTTANDVSTGQRVRNLLHGRVVHGSQFQENELEAEPTTYYSSRSGVGLALQNHWPNRNDRDESTRGRHVGVVGLGAGTLATYGQPSDSFRFYEINPQVIEFANKYFTFLSKSHATIETVLGDARLTLEREPDQAFDVLVLDAFSGDAIPVHLLTREAMEIYVRHLTKDGVLAIHISNLYFDLEGIVAGLAMCDSFETTVVQGEDGGNAGALTSKWVLLSRSRDSLQQVLGTSPSSAPVGRPVLWTDDRNDLLKALK